MDGVKKKSAIKDSPTAHRGNKEEKITKNILRKEEVADLFTTVAETGCFQGEHEVTD